MLGTLVPTINTPPSGVFPGLFALQNEKLRDLLDVKVFVDEDSDIRLARRLKRDISERNREMVGVLKQYNRFVKPSFDTHIKPTAKCVLRHAQHCSTSFQMTPPSSSSSPLLPPRCTLTPLSNSMCDCTCSYADLVIPRGASNTVAMHLLITEVKNQLKRRGFDIRKQLVLRTCSPEIPATATILPQTKQLKSYHTIICDATTSREDFVFHSERLMRLVLEFLVSRLPHTAVEVPLGSAERYDTKRCARAHHRPSIIPTSCPSCTSHGPPLPFPTYHPHYTRPGHASP